MPRTASPPASSRPKAWLPVGWSVLWGVLAVLHVTQGIWRSGGAAYPGDLGDGRFNQLVLEHGYQSLRGVYEWSSPGQFFPAKDTLGYSDTHAGTLPLYALVRLLGASMEQAWQAWFVLVGALNAAAGFYLFRALRVDGWLRGPLVFAAVAPATMVWIAGSHMQLLPVFPGLLAWAELVSWHDDRRGHRLAAASGWAAWQFAAGPYLAFFWAVITVTVGALRWLIGRTPPPVGKADDALRPRRSWVRSGGIALAGWALLIAVALVYVKARQAGLSRSMAEVELGTPIWRSWLTAPPNHAFYPPGWPAHQPGVEHSWFAGFLPLLLLPVALGIGWKNRRTASGAWLLALSGGVLATIFFFTKTSENGSGLWIAVASRIDALHAFRETTRVAILLQVVEIASAALLLSLWQPIVGERWRVLPVLAAVLIAAEGLATRQPVEQLAVARARSDAMIAAWRKAGGRPVLAYAYGYTRNTDALLQLDAWSAALRLKKTTINGFGGSIPGSHFRFIWNPTPENAQALIADAGLSPNTVSIVTELSAKDAAALGIVQYAERPIESLMDFDLQPLSWKLFAPIEHSVIDGVTMYQFTPAAEVRFRLPDGASHIDYLVGFRPDAYTLGGKTDGAGVGWWVQAKDQPEKKVTYELLTPLSRPDHRGLLARSLELPPGRDRILVLRTDTGPANFLPWDFVLVGRLQVK